MFPRAGRIVDARVNYATVVRARLPRKGAVAFRHEDGLSRCQFSRDGEAHDARPDHQHIHVQESAASVVEVGWRAQNTLVASDAATPEVIFERSDQPLEEPLYHLVLLDDDDHTYQYVIELLGRVLGYQSEKAFALACIVDSEGRATIETAQHEQVTQHQRQIHAFGPDPRVRRCRRSMAAVVEPAA